jgi:hypothetical protein
MYLDIARAEPAVEANLGSLEIRPLAVIPPPRRDYLDPVPIIRSQILAGEELVIPYTLKHALGNTLRTLPRRRHIPIA